MFLVAKKDGGQRPVINLKPLNCYVNTEHFKMEGIHCLPNLLKSGDWMAKIDLKDAYFMIPIQEQDRAFLTFRFRDQLFQFRCLPFGLSCAPWVFTKTLKPVVAQLRQLGIRLVVYIDDILIMAESRELAQENVIGLVFLLENLGFVINRDKSILEPTQEIEFRGFNVNSVNTELSLPSKKIKQIRSDIRQLCNNVPTTARKLSQLLGRLQAATKAIPPAPLFYRQLQRKLITTLDKSNHNYDQVLTLGKDELEELEWWLNHMSFWNGKTLMAERPSLTIESDASRRGWGATCNGSRTGGPWSNSESQYHINTLEAVAAFHAIKCFAKDRRAITILLRIDNVAVVTYVRSHVE